MKRPRNKAQTSKRALSLKTGGSAAKTREKGLGKVYGHRQNWTRTGMAISDEEGWKSNDGGEENSGQWKRKRIRQQLCFFRHRGAVSRKSRRVIKTGEHRRKETSHSRAAAY